MALPRRARIMLATVSVGALTAGAVGIVASAQGATVSHNRIEATAKGSISFARVAGTARNAGRVGGIAVAKTPIPGRLLPLDAAGKFPAAVIPSADAASLGGQNLGQVQAGATAVLQARQATAAALNPGAAATTLATLALPAAGSYAVTVTGDLSATTTVADRGANVTVTAAVGATKLSDSGHVLQPRVASGANLVDAADHSATYVVTVTGARTITVTAVNSASGAAAIPASADDTAIIAVRLGQATGATAIP
jgi:hypothetical protein